MAILADLKIGGAMAEVRITYESREEGRGRKTLGSVRRQDQEGRTAALYPQRSLTRNHILS